MNRIRWVAVVLLFFSTVMGSTQPRTASAQKSNEADSKHTYFRLVSAVGSQTLPLNPESIKSPNKAFLYSGLVPGSGQLYIGAKRGYAYIAAEVAMLATYFFLDNDAENLRDSYREKVREGVTFDGPGTFETWDPIEDFEHATLFDNWHNVYTDNNGEPLERVGKWYWEDRRGFKDETRAEHDSELRQDALKLREDANDKFQLAKTFLGVVILNHVVSAIDARISTKSYNKKHASPVTTPKTFELDLQTTISSDAVRSQIVLSRRF